MSERFLRPVALALAMAAALVAWAREDGAPAAPARLVLSPRSGPGGAGDGTRCEACHTTSGWQTAAFDHDRTGFPLKGAHAGAGCKSCHTIDLTTPLSRNCTACHQDAHAGELGKQCQSCHTEENWKPIFDVDAHRRTNFPLVGAHAVVPCLECHTDMANRKFARTAVNCVGCHAPDYARATAFGVDHVALGFSTSCADCHTAVSFRGAHFLAHDSCFQLSVGPHSTIDCLTCHTSLAGVRVTGLCQSGTATCSTCHAHVCSAMDKLHQSLPSGTPPGYQCSDPKCYKCHEFIGTP